jgi:hypothetical protein
VGIGGEEAEISQKFQFQPELVSNFYLEIEISRDEKLEKSRKSPEEIGGYTQKYDRFQ